MDILKIIENINVTKRCFVFFVPILFFSIQSCVVDKFDDRLKFINYTDKSLLIYGDFFLLNDTLINCSNCYTGITENSYLKPKDTLSIGLHGKLYDEYLMKNPNKIFRVFVFESDTIKKYGWEKAQKEYLILKRFDINLEYIKNNNWIIKYPDSVNLE